MELSLFQPLDKKNIKNEFVLHIEDLILSGRLPPGDRFPAEREIAEHYGVSRPLIHAGFLILETRGLVTLRPRHGIIVNNYRRDAKLDVLLTLLESSNHELSENIHTDLEHFRTHIEKDMVILLCRKTDDEASVGELEDINNLMAASSSPEETAEYDFSFHQQLAFLSGNTLYPLLANTLKPAHTRYLNVFYKIDGNKEKAVGYHRQLIDAIKKGDEESAVGLIEILDSYSSYS